MTDAIDLCDALSSFSSQGKTTLHEISRIMGLLKSRAGPAHHYGIGREREQFRNSGPLIPTLLFSS
jgi:hypothetical protein